MPTTPRRRAGAGTGGLKSESIIRQHSEGGGKDFRNEEEFIECTDTGFDACQYYDVGGHDDQCHQHEQQDGGPDG